MTVSAKLKYAHISAQKVRLICDKVRNKTLNEAINWLKFTPKKGARIVHKLLLSAIANAENNQGLDIDELFIFKIFADEAPRVKRFQARAKGRANRIVHQSSHITVELADLDEVAW